MITSLPRIYEDSFGFLNIILGGGVALVLFIISSIGENEWLAEDMTDDDHDGPVYSVRRLANGEVIVAEAIKIR